MEKFKCEILGGPHERDGTPLFRVTRLPAAFVSDKAADQAMAAIAGAAVDAEGE